MRRRRFLETAFALPAVGAALAAERPAPQPDTSQPVARLKVAGIVARWVKDVDNYREVNFARVTALIRQAAAEGAKLVCTTECFLDGYYREVTDQQADLLEMARRCEAIDSSLYVKKLSALAGELRIAIVAGMAIREGNQLFNSAQLYTPSGKLAGLYRKTHNFGRHSQWFAVRGKQDRLDCFPSFDLGLNVGRAGMMICNDRNFAHTAYDLARNGSQFLLCPTGGSYSFDQLARHAAQVGLWSIWVHPLGAAVIDDHGHPVVQQRNPLSDDWLAVPAAELDSPDDRQFTVLADVELRTPNLSLRPAACPGDKYPVGT